MGDRAFYGILMALSTVFQTLGTDWRTYDMMMSVKKILRQGKNLTLSVIEPLTSGLTYDSRTLKVLDSLSGLGTLPFSSLPPFSIGVNS